MITARLIGFVFLPTLLKFNPLLLILVSPFIHHLILTSTLIAPTTFLSVGVLVAIFQCSVGYSFGKIHGRKAIEWLENKDLVTESKVNLIQRAIRFSAPLVLFLIPGPLASMITGVSQLKPKTFFLCMFPSQILWIYACYSLGTKLEVYLNQINTWLIDNWIVITLGIIILKGTHMLYTHYIKKKT